MTVQEAAPDRGGTWRERKPESLVPGLRVEGLQGVWLALERAALDLAPIALVRGEVRLEGLDAAFVRLDRLGLSGGAAGTTGPALEAGRYVAPGVFVGVRQGARGRTGVEVEVELTERLKLEAQTATGPAGDRIGLAYEFEC